MLNFSQEALEKAVSIFEQVCKNRGEEMVVLEQEIAALQNEKTEIIAQVYKLNRNVEICKKHIIIARGVPEAIEELRSHIQSTARELLRTDIFVVTEKTLRFSFVELQKQLKEECKHCFIVGYIGFQGSYTMDHDDGYCGERLCLVCGKMEHSRDKTRPCYVYLTESPERLVVEGVWEKDFSLNAIRVFSSLEALVECAFMHRDGNVNLLKRLCALGSSLKK